ncbi:M50 family metallopeptidase [Caldalkalibacillus salinus]|uniref:M50 family metallopeptidase n=1 Tax=Caldalkalibacillus salinus TaxID=2803787 RepID=UPI0019231273|nr:M50 family metallopeptidase [Caldalkalibacillus salinus]
MDVLYIFLLLILFFPVVSYIHEWGHVSVAKLCQMQVTRVQLGTGRSIKAWKHGRIPFEWNWNNFLGGYTEVKDEEAYPKWQRLCVAMGGGVLSFITYILSWELYVTFSQSLNTLLAHALYVFLVLNLYMTVVQWLPYRKGISRLKKGWPSDGLMVLSIIFSRNHVKARNQEKTGQKAKGNKGHQST